MSERDYPKELRDIMNRLAEWTATASAEDMIEDAREAGDDIRADAESLRARLRGVVKEYGLRRLEAARTQRQQALAALARAQSSLPQIPNERRELFNAVLARNAEMAARLTVQYRDLQTLSDQDIESALRDLQSLGILKDFLSNQKG